MTQAGGYHPEMTEQAPLAGLPAICRGCGSAFHSGFTAGPGTTMVMEGCVAGPCPSCGAMGDIPDGAWRLIPRVLQIARETRPTLPDLTTLRRMVQDVDPQDTFDLDVFAAEAKRKAPSAAPLLQALRDPATETIVSLLSLVMAIVALIVAMGGSPEPEPEDEPVKQPHSQQGRHRDAESRRGDKQQDPHGHDGADQKPSGPAK